jgi:hypothetical protein
VIDTLSLKAPLAPPPSIRTSGVRQVLVARFHVVAVIADRLRSAESIGSPMK